MPIHPVVDQAVAVVVPVVRPKGFVTIQAAEYFVDTDPEGNGTVIQAQDGAFDSEVESILPKDLNVTETNRRPPPGRGALSTGQQQHLGRSALSNHSCLRC